LWRRPKPKLGCGAKERRRRRRRRRNIIKAHFYDTTSNVWQQCEA
jgi:hypothetical protein